MPRNIINWSDITRHWEWPPLKSCPLPEDFVTYNGLWPAKPTWFAPHWRTLSHTTDFNPLGQHDFSPHWRTSSHTMDFDPLGQHDLPLVGGLCHVQQTLTSWVNMICPSLEDFVLYNELWPAGSQWSHNKIYHQQTNQWHIKSDTKNNAKRVPKDQLLLVVQVSDPHRVRWDWSNLPEWFEDFGWTF